MYCGIRIIVHRKHFKIIILLSHINLIRYMILRSNVVLDFCIVLNVKQSSIIKQPNSFFLLWSYRVIFTNGEFISTLYNLAVFVQRIDWTGTRNFKRVSFKFSQLLSPNQVLIVMSHCLVWEMQILFVFCLNKFKCSCSS